MRILAIVTLVFALCCLAGAFVVHGAAWQTGARIQKSVVAIHDSMEPPAASGTSASPAASPSVDVKQEIRSLRWNGVKSLHLQQSASGMFLMGTAVFSFSSLVLMVVSTVRDGRNAPARPSHDRQD